MDILVQRIESGESGDYSGEYEFPLYSNPAFFKGTKPVAVFIGMEWVAVKKWREVYTIILNHANADPKHHEKLMNMRNIMAGRKRAVISDKPEGMDVPIQLDDELYVEAYFDTEWLIKNLTRILGAIGYNYNGISVLFRKGGAKFD